MRPIVGTIAVALAAGVSNWAPSVVAGGADVYPRDQVAIATDASAAAGGGFASVPPAPWSAQDPADSLYRTARQALNDGDYARAASLFRQIVDRYPRSEYAADAYYWAAFARYQMGGERNLRDAVALIERQRSRFPNAATRGDARTLETRIRGALARGGDPGSAASLLEDAKGKGGGGRRASGDRCERGDDEDEPRIAALSALMHMDSERAMPILREVLARRDACSEVLRRKAVFLVAQHHTADAADVLLDVTRKDPDAEVRRQAVFWMSQLGDERAVTVLDSIMRSSGDADLREKAVFALSQQNNERSRKSLRAFAQSDAPLDLREKAVFWIGQGGHDADNATFLRALYARPGSEGLREEIIQAMASVGGEENTNWLFSIAQDAKADMESRKKALFWLGQQGRVPAARFASLYDSTREREVREQIIFVLSQRREVAATDKLMDIARRETDRELRGKAIFWLGQKNDPRVKQLLLEIINQ